MSRDTDTPERAGLESAAPEGVDGARRAKHLSLKNPRGFLWATLLLLLFSMAGHWIFGWRSFVHEAEAHHQSVEAGEYVDEMLRDTFENWQSEFLQLIWQVAGLAVLLYVGSSQSKEGDDRIEAKVDYLIRKTQGGDAVLRDLDQRYLRKE
jgi:hypothetical protein